MPQTFVCGKDMKKQFDRSNCFCFLFPDTTVSGMKSF